MQEVTTIALEQTEIISAIDTVWVAICAAIIFLMEGGFALLEAGLSAQAVSAALEEYNEFVWQSISRLKIETEKAGPFASLALQKKADKILVMDFRNMTMEIDIN